ncbi:MAG: hypothetical protein NTY07_12595 [Bacteroidia bacterium]|nr:hypothetical protein [Bacteroidia bacterium]
MMTFGILERTADDITSTGIGFDNDTGYGKVNAYSALSLLNTPNVLYHGVSIGGTSVKLSTISQWIYYGPQWGLASGIYYDVDQYQITKHITFDVPFCSVPQVWMRDRESTCLGFGNPNDGYPYAIITNITNTGFDVKYATYYVRYNSLGQTFNRWVPVEPASSKIAYSAIGQPNLAGTAGPISGPNFVCSSNAIFTVNNLPIGSTIIWNNSSNLSRISNQGTNPCTFTTAGSGTGWIEATIPSTGCGDVILPRKNVWVGPPILQITGPDYACAGDDGLQFFASGGGATSYLWEIEDGEIQIIGANDQQMCAFYFYPNYVQGELHVTASNECGIVDQYRMLYYSPSCDNNYYYAFSPNPATANLTVEQLTAKEASTRSVLQVNQVSKASGKMQKDNSFYTIEIWHENKGKVKTIKSNQKKQEIDVSMLEKGRYFLHIITPTAIYKEQLLIK